MAVVTAHVCVVSLANAVSLVFHSIAPASSLTHQYCVESLARPNIAMAVVVPPPKWFRGAPVVPTSRLKDGAMAGRITHMHVIHCCYNVKGWP